MKSNENDPKASLEPSLGLEDVQIPSGVDRRAFLMRSALIGAVAVLNGCSPATPPAGTAPPASPPVPAPAAGPSPDLDVVKKAKGPVMTVIDEFYKVGPGPSSSHTIGPMRITYDFYQRCTKLPADQLAKATALKVNLFGSLSATGKGHGTERAALAGIIGKEPATIDPLFLDETEGEAGPDLPGEARQRHLQCVAQGHHLRRAEGQLPAPEHDDLQADGGRHRAPRAGVLLGRRRVHRVEGLRAAEEGRAEVSRTRRWPSC